MEHTKHLWRAGLLLLVALLGATVARYFLVPETFGEHGYYRYSSLAEFMKKEPVHGGLRGCAGCHEEVQDARDDSPHATVSCAECHAPLSVHAEGEDKTADMPTDATYRTCIRCHRKLRARPEAMKQIVFREHLEELGVIDPGEDIPPKCCKVCHDPHTTKERE